MGYRGLRLALFVAFAAAALLGVAAAAHAQQIDPSPAIPVSCAEKTRYDINLDGEVDWRDMDMWVRAVHESGESCRLGGPVSGCPRWVDTSGDGFVSHEDLNKIVQYINWCTLINARPPRTGTP